MEAQWRNEGGRVIGISPNSHQAVKHLPPNHLYPFLISLSFACPRAIHCLLATLPAPYKPTLGRWAHFYNLNTLSHSRLMAMTKRRVEIVSHSYLMFFCCCFRLWLGSTGLITSKQYKQCQIWSGIGWTSKDGNLIAGSAFVVIWDQILLADVYLLLPPWSCSILIGGWL